MTEPQTPDPQTPDPQVAAPAPTPGEARREGMKKSKWVAAGVAVGAAAFLTGVIAGVNGVGDSSDDGQQISSAVPGGFQQAPGGGFDNRSYDSDDDDRYESDDDDDDDRYESDDDDDRYESDDDDDRYESDDDDGRARPFDPQSGGASSGSTAQPVPSGPQSRSGGS